MSEGKFFWNDKEVTRREYMQKKFCLCGALNKEGLTMCSRCKKSSDDLVKMLEKKNERR